MKNPRLSNILLLTLVAIGSLLGGCESRQDRAREAFAEYQSSVASGNLPAARRALLQLVATDDTVATYWVELGKVQLQLSDYGPAYNSFVRAHELDRADGSILGILTQLSLRSGNLDQAEQFARELELVAPDNIAVPLTYGYVALRRGDFAEANKQVGLLIAAAPYDSSGKVLQARILLQSGQPQKAVDLLKEQVRLQPSDEASLRALRSIYELREQWADAASTARALLAWRPKDQEVRKQLIESELRAGRTQQAIADTVAGLAAANAHDIELLLAPWLAVRASDHMVKNVFELGRTASPDRRVALARFLAAASQPQLVITLTRDLASLPIDVSNVAANSLYGAALGQVGKVAAGLDRLNKAVALDGANVDALRGRAELQSRRGAAQLAIEDAQKLVAADRGSPQARLLLARIYLAAGDRAGATRALWEAFHDIPAERSIYEALKGLPTTAGDSQAVRRLDEEFYDQCNQEMVRDFA